MLPAHDSRLAAHVVVQAPMEQTWPASQVWPQVPQLVLSVESVAQYADVSRSEGWQSATSAPQVGAHVLAVQAVPFGQAVPHVPQLALSVWVLAQ
jgi:hypothetical protein